jgi:D-glycero-alpha-D-manno-heptose-7-phosphate kinase
MKISKTPFRISFFGGGTDYAPWYSKHGGAVLSTTIDKYCFITARFLPPFFPNKSRVVWNRIEEPQSNDEIQHPSVRAVLKHLSIESGIEIHTMGDLPSRSGLGSSSTFTVGLLNVLSSLRGKSFNKAGLALEAVHIEREILKENVGIQDQLAAAYGGLNKTTIHQDGGFFIEPVKIPFERMLELQNHCMLFFTGVSRSASDIAAEQIASQSRGEKDAELHRMREMVDTAIGILKYNVNISEFGNLLDESWQIKRTLAKNISPQFVDDIYERGRNAGAIGGKLLGAGGGGFMLFFAKPENHDKIRAELSDLLWIPFKFENKGSEIIYGL